MKGEPDIREKYPAGNTEEPTGTPLLQVMICTYGEDGIRRLAQGKHPEMPEVEYIVSWQIHASTPVPAELVRRDMKIFRTATKGLSVNRNHALSKATAPLLLISDDDVDYTEEMLKNVIEEFEKHPECDILTFRYESGEFGKTYPEESFLLSRPLKGYFLSSIELAFRRGTVQNRIWFNENFGIGAVFPAGEEDIFLYDCLKSGLNGRFIPFTIARHDSDTTSVRNRMLHEHVMTKGAVFLHTHSYDWILRMFSHAVREIPLWRKGKGLSPVSYMRNWLKGVSTAKKLSVFPTPDYSDKYLNK